MVSSQKSSPTREPPNVAYDVDFPPFGASLPPTSSNRHDASAQPERTYQFVAKDASMEEAQAQAQDHFKHYRMAVKDLPKGINEFGKCSAALYRTYLECDENQLFPMTSVYTFRGAERPSLTRNSKHDTIVRSRSCMIQFRDLPDIPNSGVYGCLEGKMGFNDEASIQNCVEAGFRPDTGAPSIVLRIRPASLARGKEAYTFNVFANSLKRTRQKIGLQFSYGSDAAVLDTLPHNVELQSLARDGKLWRIDIDMYENDSVPVSGAVGDPVWDNITKTERDCIAEWYNAPAGTGDRALDLIHNLSRSRHITIFRQLIAEPNELPPFHEYMSAVMYASTQLGNFWWYTIWSDGHSISDSDYPFFDSGKYLPRPRWLIRNVSVCYELGKPIWYKPRDWAVSHRLDKGPYPDEETPAFHMRLAEVRRLQKQDEQLIKLAKNRTITCKVTELDTGGYYLPLLLTAIDSGQETGLFPGLTRNATVCIRYQGEDIIFTGITCENAENTLAHLSVMADSLQHPTKFTVFGKTFWASVTIDRDAEFAKGAQLIFGQAMEIYKP